ncbi:hypothetical protein JL722_4869 [Aureococcus anophagefferens]|nr:hypothetical protein JL722_4869 [Aureococcus anophagefferens]
MKLTLALATGAAASGNMNGPYTVSSGAGKTGVAFNSDYASKGHEYFDAITGYEMDMVMVSPLNAPGQHPENDVSVPINWAYNHHYEAWMTGKYSELRKIEHRTRRTSRSTIDTRNRECGVRPEDVGNCTKFEAWLEPKQARSGRSHLKAGSPYSGVLECPCTSRYGGSVEYYGEAAGTKAGGALCEAGGKNCHQFNATPRCAGPWNGEPSASGGELLAMGNPTCASSTYAGGLQCCGHKRILLDADQDPGRTSCATT